MALTVNERLAREAILHRIRLLRHANAVERDIGRLLINANEEIAAKLLSQLKGVNVGNMSGARLKAIAREMRRLLVDVHSNIIQKLGDEVEGTGVTEAKYQAANLTRAIPSAVIAEIPVTAITWQQALAVSRAASVMDLVIGETTLGAWADRLGEGMAQRIVTAAAQAIREGKTSLQAVADIQQSGMMKNAQRNLQTLAHQAINAIAADAREATARANADLIKYRLWLSTLDNRTSPMCIVRDHVLYTMSLPVRPVKDGDPEYGAGPGKLHWRCRSVETWVVKSADELDVYGGASVRASLDGVVPANMNYREWLAQASPDVQDEVLGITRAEMLRSGKYTVDDFFDDGRIKRLKDLR